MTALPTPRAIDAREEGARIRDLAPEMLSILESVAAHEHVMDTEFSATLRARIRATIDVAHGG